MSKILLFFLVFVTFSTQLYSQEIKGKVIDAGNSEPMVGAIVKVMEDKTGAETDLDGTYTITVSKPGTYTVEFSYVGYKTYSVKNVKVSTGQVTKLDAALNGEGISTEEITVEATTSMANENTLLVEQKNSNKISDGISEQQIKRAPDAAASEVLKRVIGVSIVKDKFVYVRGTADRYNNTLLNGVMIPSTEPDKKAFSFDLFPSNLIENLIISKSFTPDQPADYAGGLVQITTKEFPDELTVNFVTSGSILSKTTGDDFYHYNAGFNKLGFLNLGTDNGDRELPSVIPASTVSNVNFTRREMMDFGRSFKDDWGVLTDKAKPNGGFQLSVGNNFTIGKSIPLGFLASYSYRNGFATRDLERNLYNTDDTQELGYTGKSSEYSVAQGGLLNINTKLNEFNKLTFKSIYTLNSEDETEYYEGFVTRPADFDRKVYLTHFTQRDLISGTLSGSHLVTNFHNLSFQWRASYSESNRKEPDQKSFLYQRERLTTDDFRAPITVVLNNDVGGRFFQNLRDYNRSFSGDFELPVSFGSVKSARLKFGGLLNNKSRDFVARNFGTAVYLGAEIDRSLPIEQLLSPENIDTTKIYYGETTKQTDRYTAGEDLSAGYLMFDAPYRNLRLIIGARIESDEQNVGSFNVLGEPIENKVKNTDILPAINFTYTLNSITNLRASYTQTVSRPELRELAPFSFNDFLTNTLVRGNPELRRSLIRNYDLRFEMYPAAGEIIALSLFYKKFDSPIEEVFIATANNPEKTFQNANGGATNYGIELELRKNLGFINKKIFRDFSVNANVTLLDSKVDLEGTGTSASQLERRMQGQSPYSVNLGLFYDNFDLGTSVNLLYNKFGNRISEVGVSGFNDIEENGRDLLDFTVAQRFLKRFEAKFSMKDILNQDQIYTQKIGDEDKVLRRIKSGSGIGLSISYKF